MPKLFKKNLSPEELGRALYERLRANLEAESSELNLSHFLSTVSIRGAEPHDQSAGEIIVGVMFAATLATERSTTANVAQRVVGGMKSEFLSHLAEQGADELQRAEWEATMAGRFLAYRRSMEGYSGFEPPWKLGRELFWNLTDNRDYVAMSIKIATLYLLRARDVAQE